MLVTSSLVMLLQRLLSPGLLAVLAASGIVEAKYSLGEITTGVDQGTGARPARRNILDLQNDIPTWYFSLPLNH